MNPDTEIRWGIIGCGNVCEHKGGPPLYRVAGSRLIGVTRRDSEKGRDYARRHGPCRFYESATDLLAEPAINAVYVASPHTWHHDHTLAAARAGKHVLVEKPMANNTAECDEMIAACRDAGVTLAVAYYRRCYPSVIRLHQLLREQAIGLPQTIRVNNQFPASHRLDLIHFLFGPIESVWITEIQRDSASDASPGFELHTRSANGVEGIMEIGWRETRVPEQIEVIGTTGRIWVNDLKGGSLIREQDRREHRETFPPLPATHWGLIENFVGHINHQTPLACDGVEGRKSTVILDIVSNLKVGKAPVRVDYANPPAGNNQQAAQLGLLG